MRTRPGPRRLALAVTGGLLAALFPLGSGAEAQIAGIICSSQSSVVANLDGVAGHDLVVGAPGDDLEQQEIDGSVSREFPDAGSVNFVYSRVAATGTPPGLHPSVVPGGGMRFVSQDSPNVVDDSEAGDQFGFSSAVGDFNGDGFPDVAIGVPGENSNAGAVHIFYGTAAGPAVGTSGSALFNRLFGQGSRLVGTKIKGSSEAGDRFGHALAAGDLNGDGIADLAIGAPGENVGSKSDAGAVSVIYGRTGVGLDPAASAGRPADQIFDLETNPGEAALSGDQRAESGDSFGASLTIGQFNSPTTPLDLAVGLPGEDQGGRADLGAVMIIHGNSSATGLSLTAGGPSFAGIPAAVVADLTDSGPAGGFRFFHQDIVDFDGSPEVGDKQGCSLAAGDFDGDGDDDLANGVTGEDIGSAIDAGVVHVVYNAGAAGITATPIPGVTGWTEDIMWTENAGGIPGVAKSGDHFSSSLYAGGVGGDGADDLVIGVADEELYGLEKAGSIRVMFGFAGFGLVEAAPGVPTLAFAQRPSSTILPADFSENGAATVDYTPVGMMIEKNDRFGHSVVVGEFDGVGLPDIVVSTPNESVGFVINYVTEEVVGYPQDIDGLPAPLDGALHLDDSANAGAFQVIYGAAGAPTFDVMYRHQGFGRSPGVDSLAALSTGESHGRGILQNLQGGQMEGIGNPGLDGGDAAGVQSSVIEGDNLGTSLS